MLILTHSKPNPRTACRPIYRGTALDPILSTFIDQKISTAAITLGGAIGKAITTGPEDAISLGP